MASSLLPTSVRSLHHRTGLKRGLGMLLADEHPRFSTRADQGRGLIVDELKQGAKVLGALEFWFGDQS